MKAIFSQGTEARVSRVRDAIGKPVILVRKVFGSDDGLRQSRMSVCFRAFVGAYQTRRCNGDQSLVVILCFRY